MASNAPNNLDLFSSPDNQGVNSVDQTLNLTGTSSVQVSPLLWDDLTADAVGPTSPSTAPTTLSFGSLAQASGSSALTDPNSPAPSRPSSYGGQSRQILPTRAPRQRAGHERKRSKLSTDSTPFDSVDYWIQFDNDESALADVPEDVETTVSKPENATGAPSMQRARRTVPRPPLRSATSVSDVSSRVHADEYYIDDSALENALSDDDQAFSINLADHLSKYDSAPPRDVPPREGLYSTPLSWEKPQPGLRMDSLMGLNSPILSEAEQRRLIAIAMNPGPSTGGLGSNISLQYGGLDTTLAAGLGTTTMSQISNLPGPQQKPQARPPQPGSLKRQGSGLDKEKDKVKSGDRAAHNDIERKYRTNLKDKIAELRDAVPSLRTISEVDGDELDGSQPSRAPKVSKGTVLTKATEYIHYLERRNKQIVLEHNELSRRLQAFEQLLQASARQNFQMPSYSRTLFDPRGFC
ncbi:HLH-domain-containing protein [Thozetella sp. PMI_491]|nr:HLH-domain-containing protein [Thozetella sp. PMI_491]